MDNAADRKSIRAKEKSSKLADQNRREVLVGIMSTTFGREWIWNLLERAHIFRTSFTPDPYLTAFNEGERNQGQLLLNDIMEACPDLYILAQRENNERRTQQSSTANQRTAGELNGSEEPGRVNQGYADSAESFPDGGEEGRTDH